MTFVDAWWWLHNHPINLSLFGFNKTYSRGMDQLDIYVYANGPVIHLEFGPFPDHVDDENKYDRMHDPNLDVSGATFEEAIINLAAKVKKHYGDY